MVSDTDTATVIAPNPTSSKYLVSAVLPDGTTYDVTNPLLANTGLPAGTDVTFALTMHFPNVHTTGAVLKDYLPLIM